MARGAVSQRTTGRTCFPNGEVTDFLPGSRVLSRYAAIADGVMAACHQHPPAMHNASSCP